MPPSYAARSADAIAICPRQEAAVIRVQESAL
jgi:hypothetical protein